MAVHAHAHRRRGFWFQSALSGQKISYVHDTCARDLQAVSSAFQAWPGQRQHGLPVWVSPFPPACSAFRNSSAHKQTTHTQCSPRQAHRCVPPQHTPVQRKPQPPAQGCSSDQPMVDDSTFHDPQNMKVKCTAISGLRSACRGRCHLAPPTLLVLMLGWQSDTSQCHFSLLCWRSPLCTFCRAAKPFASCTALSMQGRPCLHGQQGRLATLPKWSKDLHHAIDQNWQFSMA